MSNFWQVKWYELNFAFFLKNYEGNGLRKNSQFYQFLNVHGKKKMQNVEILFFYRPLLIIEFKFLHNLVPVDMLTEGKQARRLFQSGWK